MSFPKLVFGCGQDGNFPGEGSGIVGRGVEKESLMTLCTLVRRDGFNTMMMNPRTA